MDWISKTQNIIATNDLKLHILQPYILGDKLLAKVQYMYFISFSLHKDSSPVCKLFLH